MLTRDLPAAAQRMTVALLLQLQAILRWRPDRFTLLLTILSLLGAAFILARQVNYGVGLGLDSIHYISVARYLLAGEGFVELTNKELYVALPPLYPVLLAVVSLFVFDPYAVAGPLNAAIFGLTILVAGHYLRQRIHSRFLILWACLAILLSIPLTSIAYTAMSEVPFILFVTLSLLHTDTFLHQGKQSSLLWAAMFASLACLTRYIGPTLMFTVLPLLLFQRNTGAVAKMKHIAAYILISVFPIALWMLRNSLLTGMPTGPRPPSDFTLPQSLDRILNSLSRWIFLDLPLAEFRSFAVLLTGLALLALAIALGGILRAQQKVGTWTDWMPFYLFGSFTLVYLISFIGTFAATVLAGNMDRYLSPMYIPLLFTAVFGMDRFLHAERQRKLLGTLGGLPFIGTTVRGRMKQVSLLAVLLSAALSLWLGWSVPINARAIRQTNEQIGPSASIARYADSAVLQYIREHSIDGILMSNLGKWYVYWYTDASDYYFLPDMTYWPAPMVNSADSDHRAAYPQLDTLHHWRRTKTKQFIGNTEDDVYLLWFYCPRTSCTETWFYGGFHTPNLGPVPELEPVVELADGIILKVNKSYGNADAYRTVTANQSIVRSNFDLYLNDNSLHYVRDTCRLADIQARFFLHIIPHDTNDLPQHRQQYGFDNLNFDFYTHGVRFDGKCLASVPLPDYLIARIRTGQWISFRQWIRSGQWRRGERQLWQGEFPFHEE